MSKLTHEQQAFIVRKLAALEPPREIVADFVAIFPGVRCDENDVRRLNPTNVTLSPELHAEWVKERERIKTDPNFAPYKDKTLRVGLLSKGIDFFLANNQRKDAYVLIRQVAEEMGDIGSKAGAKLPGASGSEDDEPVTAITRIIVHPKAPNEQQTDSNS